MIQYRPRTETRRVILQHSRTAPGHADLANHLTVRARVEGLLNLGHHALILQDGHLVETRPHPAQGSHTRGHNRDSIGVCLEGTSGITKGQRNTLRFLMGRWRGVYGRLDVRHQAELRGHAGRVAPAEIDMETLRKDLGA